MKSTNETFRLDPAKWMITSLFIIFLTSQALAQSTQTFRGTVLSADDNQPVPGANIYLKSLSSVGTFSDAKGEFVFPRQLKSGDVIVFSFLGLKTTEYVVTDSQKSYVTIIMPPDPTQMVDDIIVEADEQKSGAVPGGQSLGPKVNRRHDQMN